MKPDDRKALLWVLCEFSNKAERAAEQRDDVPTFTAYLGRELARLLEHRDRIP